jgi:hypothetical protein
MVDLIDISFLLFSSAVLFMLYCRDNDPPPPRRPPCSEQHYERYKVLLKNLQQAPEIDYMPSFNEMLQQKRPRSLSANDVDSLNLITDERLKSHLERALDEALKDSDDETIIDSRPDTPCSWDRMDESIFLDEE